MAPKTILVEVAYAEGKSQLLIRLEIPVAATILEAITASTILRQFPHLAEEGALLDRVGIFGKISPLDAALKPGDRIEIYRDLLIDPKESRRLKAATSKRQKAQAFDEKKRKQKVERKAKALFYKKTKKF